MAPVLREPMVKRNIPQNEQIFNHILILQKSALLHRCVLDIWISVNTNSESDLLLPETPPIPEGQLFHTERYCRS